MTRELPESTGNTLLPWQSSDQILDDLNAKDKEIAGYKKFFEAITNDFQEALNLIQLYQRALKILQSPDPNNVQARVLLNKYNLESLTPHAAFKILLDDRDITTHPDSLPGSAIDEGAPQLVEGEELCPECEKPLDDEEGDERFIYRSTLEDIATGEKIRVCYDCGMKAVGLDG